MAKITMEDVCKDIAENKNYYFYNGFYFDGVGDLLTREELRKQLATRWGRYARHDVDKMEEVVTEFNVLKDKDPRKIYLDSTKATEGNCFMLDWLKKEYGWVDWEQILYDIVMHKSEKIYIFYGVPKAGKSQILDLLKILFGEFFTPLTINQMGNRFNLGQCIGMLFVAGDDLGTESLGDMAGIIKSMATGNTVSMERKFLAPVQCENKANFLFNTNKEPLLDITDEGILRRFVLITFDKEMELPCDYKEFREKYINELEASKLLYKLKKVVYNKNCIDEINLKTQQHFLIKSSVFKSETKDYEEYANYCKANGYKSFNKENFEAVLKLIKKTKADQQPIPIEIDEEDLPF